MKILSLYLIIFFLLNMQESFVPTAKLQKVAEKLQQKCVASFPQFESDSFSHAYICGADSLTAETRATFRNSGLIHLLIVSGGHLSLLMLFLSLFTGQQKSRHLFWEVLLLGCLLAYVFMTGFQEPVVRAWGLLFTSFLQKQFKLAWTYGDQVLFSGLAVLLLFPDWILSLSFLLSWLACLGFCYPKSQNQGRLSSPLLSYLLASLLIQLFVSLVFLKISWVHLLSNLLVAPILSLLLWPLCLLPLVSSHLHGILNIFWQHLLEFLNWIGAFHGETTIASPIHWHFLWLMIALLHGFFKACQLLRFQGQHV